MKFKKQSISFLSVVIHFIVLALVLVVCGKQIVINKSIVADKNNFCDNVKINYRVYGLSAEQQDEYLKREDVDFIYSFYDYETNVIVNGGGYKANITIYSNNNVSNTPFSQDRLIESDNNSNAIYIDYLYASNNNLKLNDSIKIKFGSNVVDCKVSGIYKTNYFDDSHVMIYYNDFKSTIDKMFTKFEANYSYIYSSNCETFDSFLKDNYIPKAFMQKREDFASDIDYEIYLNNYLSKNYYNSANVKSLVVENDNNYKNETLYYFLAAVSILAVIIIVSDYLISVSYKGKLRVVSLTTNKYKIYSKVHIYSFVSSIVIGILCMLIVPLTFKSNDVKVDYLYAIENLLLIFVIYLISITIGFLCKYFMTKKMIKKKIEAYKKALEERRKKKELEEKRRQEEVKKQESQTKDLNNTNIPKEHPTQDNNKNVTKK